MLVLQAAFSRIPGTLSVLMQVTATVGLGNVAALKGIRERLVAGIFVPGTAPATGHA